MDKSFFGDILCVVVLYRQRIEESATIRSLGKSLETCHGKIDIMVYDNSPVRQYESDNIEYLNFSIIYRHNENNPGISHAYNEGAGYAVGSKKWLLLCDQDTDFGIDFFEKLSSAVKINTGISLFAPILKLSNDRIFSPCIAKHKRGYPLKKISRGRHSLQKLSVVNSGLLIDTGAFLRAGGYNERIKLDFADFQFLERYRKFDSYFYVVDSVGVQYFSNTEKSIDKQRNRFLIFLNDAKNCEKDKIVDKVGFLYTVTRHAFALAFKFRSFSFIALYYRFYLRSGSKNVL